MLRKYRAKRSLDRILASAGRPKYDVLEPNSWKKSLTDPTGFYESCVQYFHLKLSPEFREHRKYFCDSGRWFGEDAFHVLWFLLCRRFRPQAFLEIGVFRGQSLSLVALLSRKLSFPCQVTGLSPFLSAGDSVSRYEDDIDYLTDTKNNFSHFGLEAPTLWKCFSTDPEAANRISSNAWDFIYIDGNHDYEVAKVDWMLCTANLKVGGIVVLDDSALGTSYRPPAFATGGHPGPSQLASEIDKAHYPEILRVGHNRVFQKLP